MAQSSNPLQVVPGPEDTRWLRLKAFAPIHEVFDDEHEAIPGSGRNERTQDNRGHLVLVVEESPRSLPTGHSSSTDLAARLGQGVAQALVVHLQMAVLHVRGYDPAR